MGRIEEALRRRDAAIVAEGALPPRVRGREVFDSPWAFPAGQAEGGDANITRESLVPDAQGELGSFGGFDETWLPRLVTAPDPDIQLVEQFRQLAASLHHAQGAENTRIVMVTSAEPGEGKSLTALNLALTLAESFGRRVLLLDLDLRRPSLHQTANLPNVPGLGDTLRASTPQKLPVYRISERLALAPAGRPDRDPMTALTSDRMQQLMSEAALRFDWVILDAPPIGPIADSNLLAPLADGVLLVVRAGRTRYDLVQKAIESIGRDHLLGIVLNGVDNGRTAAYRDYYQANGPDAPALPRARR